MEIRFTNINTLKNSLLDLATSALSESSTAYESVWVVQEEFSKTALHTVDYGKGYYTRYIYHSTTDSGGEPSECLVDYLELKTIVTALAKTSTSSLTFKTRKANLQILGDLVVVNGRSKSKHSKEIPLYGELEDSFKLGEIHTSIYSDFPKASLPGLMLKVCLEAVVAFSGLNELASDSTILEFDGFYFKIYSLAQANGVLEIKIPGGGSSSFRAIIPTSTIKRLLTLPLTEENTYDYLSIYQKDGWVGFKSAGGKVTLKENTLDLHTERLLQYLYAPEALESYTKLCHRGHILLQDIEEALKVQRPKKNENISQILLIEEDTPPYNLQIRVAHQDSFDYENWSTVPVNILDRESDWQDTLYSYSVIDKAITVAKRLEEGEGEEKLKTVSFTISAVKVRDRINYRLDIKPGSPWFDIKPMFTLVGKDASELLASIEH